MNWSGKWLLSIALLLFLFNFVVSREGVAVMLLDEHTCPQSAWLPNRNGFRYVHGRRNSLIPRRTHIGGFEFPYIYSLKLNYGNTLHFKGKPEEDVDYFEINLLAGDLTISSKAIVALHFKIEFNKNQITLNSCNYNDWSNNHPVLPLTFSRDQPFDIRIHVKPEGYVLVGNGRKLYTFEHRFPIDIVSYVQVRFAALTLIQTGGQDFRIPYNANFPNEKFRFRDRMVISAVSDGGEFKINFLNQLNDIIMQFYFQYDKKTIVCNSYIRKRGGRPQTGKGFPLEAGVEFDIEFLNRLEGMVVTINGVQYGIFGHHTDYPEKEYLSMQVIGNVQISALQICPGD
uniref:Galectin n=1 Tax=Panagrellus redivivus TaxID=6233 RepID=A0A7E4VFF4_PANRE